MKNIYVYGPQASGKTRHAQVIAEHFGLNKIYDGWYGGTLPEQYKEDTLVLTNRADLVTMVSPRQWFELEKVLNDIHRSAEKANVYIYTPCGIEPDELVLAIMQHFGLTNYFNDWGIGSELPDEYLQDTLVSIKSHEKFIGLPIEMRQHSHALSDVIRRMKWKNPTSIMPELPTMPVNKPKLIKITLTAEFTVAIDESNEAYPVELSQDVRSTLICKEFGEFVQEAKLSVGATGGNTTMVIENADNDV